MDHQPGATHEALPLDPENDIDAKSAAIWVIGGAIVLFVALWVMVPIFIQVQDHERRGKVDLAPTTERDNVTDAEHAWLAGENPSKKSIDSVLEKLRGN